jgi:uncharacterized SAM-binding protein YcdF (DUF218 family)
MSRSRKRLFVLILVILSLLGLILFAPHYLLYSSQYKKADAIVLLLGPDFNARQKEADDLISSGMADYLIIPAYNKTYRVLNKGAIKYLPANFPESKKIRKDVDAPPYFYEDTHWEIIEAKKVMSHYELRSAIFVSSPYHMRRIKIIAARVFDKNDGVFYFIPTHYEKAPAGFWELSSADWKKVAREYGKILWFFVYFPWTK